MANSKIQNSNEALMSAIQDAMHAAATQGSDPSAAALQAALAVAKAHGVTGEQLAGLETMLREALAQLPPGASVEEMQAAFGQLMGTLPAFADGAMSARTDSAEPVAHANSSTTNSAQHNSADAQTPSTSEHDSGNPGDAADLTAPQASFGSTIRPELTALTGNVGKGVAPGSMLASNINAPELTMLTGDRWSAATVGSGARTEETMLTVDAYSAGSTTTPAVPLPVPSASISTASPPPTSLPQGRLTLSTATSKVLEGANGTTTHVVFVLTRSESASAESVTWQALGLDPSRFPGGVLPTGTVSFAIGENSREIVIDIAGDRNISGNANLGIQIVSHTSNLIVGNTDARVQIVDDDSVLSIASTAPTVLEGPTGGTTEVRFTITRTGALLPGSAGWTAEGLPTSAFPDGVIPSGLVEFAEGETSKTISIFINGDATRGADQPLSVHLTSTDDNASIDTSSPSAVVTVQDDDSVFGVEPGAPSVTEGAQGEYTEITFTISRDNGLVPATIDWTTTGLSPNDFVDGEIPHGSLEFDAGETVKTVTVRVRNDGSIEPSETLHIQLSSTDGNVTIDPLKQGAETVIQNDDGIVSLSPMTTDIDESLDGEPAVIRFTVTRTEGSGPGSVDWQLTGLDPEDLGGLPPYGTVEFAPGETTKEIIIPLTGNPFVTGDRNVTVQLTNPGPNLIVDTDSGSASMVVHDVVGYHIAALDADRAEGAQGQVSTFTFQVVRSVGTDSASTVDYRLVPSGADGADLADFLGGQDLLGSNGGLPSGTVSFAAGETVKTITVQVVGDDIVGGDESFSMLLVNPPSDARVLVGEATGTVRNDDSAYSIAAINNVQAEGSGANTVFTFQVTRTGDLSAAQDVSYAVSGTGEGQTSANDFNGAPTGIVHFAAGQSVATISVPITGDSNVEGQEAFRVVLTDAGANGQVLVDTAVATVLQDDAAIDIAAVDAVRLEGSANGNEHVFIVTRSGNTNSQVVVNWQVQASGENPVDGADFGGSMPSGTVTFEAGETSKEIRFTPSADLNFEDNETYAVSLSLPNPGAELVRGSATGVIVNDEIGLNVIATNLDQAEGDAGTRTFSFTVTRSGVIQTASSVSWSLVPSQANGVDASDFIGGVLPSGTIEFNPGEQSRVVTIQVASDSTLESDEGFSIHLSNASVGSDIVQGDVNGLVRNDDVVLNVSGVATVAEGDSGSTAITYTITRTGDLSGSDAIAYTVSGTGAQAMDASDFVGGALPSGVITFAAGQATQTVTINVQGDSSLESDESFAFSLGAPAAGATVGSGSVTTTVTNDDDVLSISAVSATALEGNGASNGATLTFVVNRTGDLSTSSTVDWVLAGSGGNPINASDVTAMGGSLTFLPGVTSQTITVQVSPDFIYEADETLTVTLQNPSAGTTLDTATASGTIQNDDSMFQIAATTTNVVEGDSGNSTHVFTITRTGSIDGAATVDWAISGATDGNDFVTTSGTVSFAAGETVKTITLQAIGDATVESNENFTVTLSNASGNVEIRTASANGTIVSDDAGLGVTAVTASVAEGDASHQQLVQFIVTRTGDVSSISTASWTLGGMQAADFVGGTIPSGTVTFAAGVTQQTISVLVAGDVNVESDETLTVTLSDPSAGTYLLSPTASTTIANDDSSLELGATPVTVNEGADTTTKLMTFTVTRSGDVSGSASAEWHLEPTGIAGANVNDFSIGQDGLGNNGGLPSGMVTFAAGETTKQITVEVRGDGSVESDETFDVVLSSATANVDLTVAREQGVITNDDLGFSVSAPNLAHMEGTGADTTFTFTVTRAGNVSSAANVDWTMAAALSGNSVNAADFGGAFPSGTVSFAAGETSKEITITVTADAVIESDEAFRVVLSNAQLADHTPQSIIDSTIVGTVVNDDSAFSIAADQASWSEGNSGYTDVTFTVTRAGDISIATSVDYAVSGSNGATGADLQGGVLPAGTLTFDEGEVSKTITLHVAGDTIVEANEVFTVTLTNPSVGTLGTAVASATVNNDDMSFSIAANAAAVNEGNSGTTAVTYTITRNGNASQAATVSWSAQTGSGLDATDFGGSVPSGTVAFAAGETTKQITINVSGDTVVENDETLNVVLSGPSAGTIEPGQGSAATIIRGDDDSFAISAGVASINESNSGTLALTFTVTRTGPANGARTLDWAATGMSANDFVGNSIPSGTLTFADGEMVKTITVNVAGDTVVESNETLTVTLSHPSTGATITSATAQTIVNNDDAALSIVSQAADAFEGNSGTVALTFQVSRTGDLTQTSTAEWRVAGSGANPANAADFATGYDSLSNGGLPSGTVTFNAGENTKTVTVYVQTDQLLESNETFNVVLSNPSTGTIVDTASATGTIRNDDAEVNFTGSTTVTKAEGDSGTTTYTYTLTRTGNLAQTTTVNLATGGTVDWSGDEAVLSNHTVVFASGESTKQITVTVIGDHTIENDETFTVTMASLSGGSSAGSANVATGIVTNDDTALSITSGDVSHPEGQSGGVTNYVYTVTRTGYTGGTTTINWSAGSPNYYENLPSASGDDFQGGSFPSGTLTFAAGETTKQITIAVNADTTPEDAEYFRVYLNNGTGSGYDQLINESARGEIARDEANFTVQSESVNRVENDDGTVDYTFAIHRTIATAGTASVNWSLVTGSPWNNVANSNAADFVNGQATSGTVNFIDGQEWGYVTITTQSDLAGEDVEAFGVQLTGSSAGTTASGTAYNQILNDDPLLSISNRSTVIEGDDGGTTAITFTVTRSGDLRGVGEVDWAASFPGAETSNESNADPTTWYRADASDFSGATSGHLVFADGVATQTITMYVNNDTLTEAWYENFSVGLSNATYDGTNGKSIYISQFASSSSATIYDNEPDPIVTVSANAASVEEGTGGSKQVSFTITRTDDPSRDGSLASPTTVGFHLDGMTSPGYTGADYASAYTIDGANANLDGNGYGVVTFAAGETTKVLTFNLTTDTVAENDETLGLVLDPRDSGGSNYGPADIGTQSSASTVIVNDDVTLYGFNNQTWTAYEGNSGTTNLPFTLYRAGRTDSAITISYTVTHGGTNGTDFVTTTGMLNLAAGQTQYQLELPIIRGDSTVEANESFTVNLSTSDPNVGFANDPNQATSSSASLSAQILADDVQWSISVVAAASVEGDDGQYTEYTYRVTRAGGGYTGDSYIDWRVSSAQANSADFYSSDSLGVNNGLPSDRLSFYNGQMSQDFTVYVRGDRTTEASENFSVAISNPEYGQLGTATVNSTIVNDDTGLAISDGSVISEGDSGTTAMTFTVTRSGDLSGASSVNWSVLHGTTQDEDFSGATSGSLSFAAGESVKTITVHIAGDTELEGDETFQIQLGGDTGIDEAIDYLGAGTIRNDDASFTITATDADRAEGAGAHTFTITRDRSTTQSETINWAVTGDTANAADFGGSLPSGSVTFAAGELVKVITVTPTDDATAEGDETYTVTISGGTGTGGDTFVSTQAQGTIRNDDATFEVTAGAASMAEGHTGTTAYTFTVTRGGNTMGAASVNWAVTGMGAHAATAADFASGTLPSGIVMFADGESVKTITIDIATDEVVEFDEGFRLTLSNPVGAQLTTATADGVITNDDSTVAIAATDASKAEGDSGATPFTFTVTRTGSLDQSATIDWAVTGSGAHLATAADFAGNGLPFGVVAFAAGESTATITVNVQGDLVGDPTEGFTVTLSDPSAGVTITNATATGSIIADDVVFDIAPPASQLEGNSGTATFTFTVTRSGDLTGSQTLDWSVAGTGANAASADDFAATTGTVTFAAGETVKTINVQVAGDTRGEPNEDFRLSLSGPAGALFTHSTADTTIIDDEASLRVTPLDANRYEGADGEQTQLTFRVVRSGNLGIAVGVDWSVAGTTANAADFAGGALPSGHVDFAAGETEKIVTVTVNGDLVIESDESFTVQLANASAGADIVGATATGTIRSDDSEWTLTRVSTASQDEGDAGPTTFTYQITRTGGLSSASVDWSVNGHGANAADAADFGGALPAGTLYFSAGQTSQTFTVQVAGDSVLENDEGFRVTMGTPNGVGSNTVLNATDDGVIVNDDSVLSIATASSVAAEGDSTTVPLTFTVTRTGSLVGTSTVDWRIAAGGDTDASDFIATSGTVTFADGESSKTITVMVAGDTVVEANENFTVELYNQSAGNTIDVAQAAGQILNQDVDLTLTGLVTTGDEGDTNNTQRTFTITRTGDTSVSTSVNWAVLGAGAQPVDAADFVTGQDSLGTNGGSPSGTITFAAGETSKQITVNVAGDGAFESTESFVVHLSDASGNAEINSNDVTATITNDDDQLSVVAVAADQLEGAAGTTTTYTFRIDRAGSSTGATSVDWSVAGMGAHPLAGEEFVQTGGTVNFAAGQTSALVEVVVRGDAVGEYDETFAITLGNPALGSTIVTASATGTVRNDDPALTISADQAAQFEGQSGNTDFTFTVTRSGDLNQVSSVHWEVQSSGTNFANVLDFGGYFPSGTVSFAAGESSKQITVAVSADTLGELDETFSVVLSNPDNADILVSAAESTINNDDAALRIEAVDADHAEGDVGTTAFTFRVVRSGDTSGTSTVDWSVLGTGDFRVDASDFAGNVMPSGSLSFTAGQSEQFITVQVATDAVAGQDEHFVVHLSNLSGGDIITSDAEGIVRNDDSEVAIQPSIASVTEGNSGTAELRYTITRSGDLTRAASVDWQVAGFGEHAADATDFIGGVLPSGTVTFAAGEASREIVVTVAGDTLAESTEQLRVQLVNPGSNVTISEVANSATGTIVADDTSVSIHAVDATHREGSSGGTSAYTFQLVRVGAADHPITVNYSINGSGITAADFDGGLTGSVVLAAGVASQLLVLNAAADSIVEGNESFTVNISADGATSDHPAASGAIIDDDAGFSIAPVSAALAEGDSGTTEFHFVVTRTGALTDSATVNWLASSDTTDSRDFDGGVLPQGTLNFAAGESSKEISVFVAGDHNVEANEHFSVTLSDASDWIAHATASVTVTNDDVAGPGDDVIYGGSGADALNGQGGDDVLVGGLGSDVLVGAEGADRFHYEAPNQGGDTIVDFEAGVDQISYTASAFGDLGSGGSLQAVTLSLPANIASAMASVSGAGDADFYNLQFANGSFHFGTGSNGDLDELETAFTNGNHTGPAFMVVSDGAGDTRLYYDADTATGTDGGGLVEIAKLPDVDPATLTPQVLHPAA